MAASHGYDIAFVGAWRRLERGTWLRAASPRDHRRGLPCAAEPVPPDPTATPDRLQIIGAMTRLSAQHRELILRAYYLRRTTVQIAADLDLAEHLVKSRLHNALHALRLILEERRRHGDAVGLD